MIVGIVVNRKCIGDIIVDNRNASLETIIRELYCFYRDEADSALL